MTTHRKLSALALVCSAPFLLLAGGCGGERSVEIGVVAPTSGQWSLYGEPIVKGIELAHEQLSQNPSREIAIELAVRDSESSPEKAAELLAELFEGDSLAALGGVTTAEALEMVPVLDREEKVMISPSATSPRLTGISQLFFRVVPSDFREGAKMGNFVAQELQIERVVIIAAESPYATGIQDVFKTEFERYGGEVLEVVEYSPGTTDFESVVEQALDVDPAPEAVYVADYAFEIGTIVGELKQSGFDGNILTTHAFAAPGLFGQLGDVAEGVLLTQTVFDVNDESPEVRRFVDAYRNKYGEEPNFFAAHGYDAMMVVAATLDTGNVRTARDFYKEVRNLRDFVGAGGPVQFDEKGDVGKFPRVYMVQDGMLVDFEQVIEQRKIELQERMQQLRERERAARRRATEDG